MDLLDWLFHFFSWLDFFLFLIRVVQNIDRVLFEILTALKLLHSFDSTLLRLLGLLEVKVLGNSSHVEPVWKVSSDHEKEEVDGGIKTSYIPQQVEYLRGLSLRHFDEWTEFELYLHENSFFDDADLVIILVLLNSFFDAFESQFLEPGARLVLANPLLFGIIGVAEQGNKELVEGIEEINLHKWVALQTNLWFLKVNLFLLVLVSLIHVGDIDHGELVYDVFSLSERVVEQGICIAGESLYLIVHDHLKNVLFEDCCNVSQIRGLSFLVNSFTIH